MVRTDPSRTAVARPLTPNPPADDGIMATDSLATQQDQQPSQQGVSDVKGPVSGNPLSPVGQASSSPMILPSIAPAVADSLGLPADGGTALQPSGASGEIEPQPDAHHVGDIPEGPPMDAAASS